MGEILYLIWLGCVTWGWYRVGLLIYTRFRPQIVKAGDLYYIRRLANPFQWEYARNEPSYIDSSKVYFSWYSDVFGKEDTWRNTSHGHCTLEAAQEFREKHFIKSKAKTKIERVDGLWFMCKNKLSKIKFRRKSAASKVN